MIKKKIILLLIINFFIFKTIPVYSFISSKIIANVGNEIITSYELKNKIKIILFLSGQDINQDNINKTKDSSFTSLVNYKIKKQEVKKYKIPIEVDVNVRKILGNVFSRYNTDQLGLKNIFLQNDLDYQFYLDEVKTEVAWQKLIYKLFNNKINLNEDDIKREIEKVLSAQKEIEEYELAEIEVEFDDDLNKKNKIDVLKKEINSIGFENTAIKYSISSSSSDKGNIGWVSSTSLSGSLLKEIKKINLGDVTSPIIQANSILFYKLLNLKKINSNNVNIEILKKRILNQERNEMLSLYSNNYLSKIKNSILIEFK
jgi:peptidyl-prolyl cis-trans isomerase SurA